MESNFSYEAPSDFAGERDREVYTVPARDKGEAEAKAFNDFKETSVYAALNLSREDLVKTTARRVTKQKIILPQLTLEEDQANFEIIPKISADNSSLEYLVTERKGK